MDKFKQQGLRNSVSTKSLPGVPENLPTPSRSNPFLKGAAQDLSQCFQPHLHREYNLGGADISQEPQDFFLQGLSRARPRLEIYTPPGTLWKIENRSVSKGLRRSGGGDKDPEFQRGCVAALAACKMNVSEHRPWGASLELLSLRSHQSQGSRQGLRKPSYWVKQKTAKAWGHLIKSKLYLTPSGSPNCGFV